MYYGGIIRVKDLVIGQVVYECEYGDNLRLTIVSEPVNIDNGYECLAITDDDETIRLFGTEKPGYEHYGPKLYSRPEYIGPGATNS